MHSHDHDLIAALAEGFLAEELALAAEADISACPACSAELADQRLALAALRDLPAPAMTGAEAAALRDAVAAAVGLPAPVPAPPAVRRRRNPWPAIAAAAGLAAAVTIVPVLGLIPTGSDDAASTTAAPTAVAFQESQPAGSPEAADLVEGDEVPSTEAALGAAPTETSATDGGAPTPVADVTTTMAPPTGDPVERSALILTGEAELTGFLEAAPHDEYLAYGQQNDDGSLPCNAAAEQTFGNDANYVDVPASLDDGRAVVLYVDGTWSTLVAFDAADCLAVLVLP